MKNPLSFISRRHFLKSAGALAACGLAGGLVPLPAFAGQNRGEAGPAQQTRMLMGTMVTHTGSPQDAAPSMTPVIPSRSKPPTLLSTSRPSFGSG